jgi:hypothetical protein
MPRTRPPFSLEFRRQAVKLMRQPGFRSAGANSSQRDAWRPLDWHGPSKQGFFCYPVHVVVINVAGVM